MLKLITTLLATLSLISCAATSQDTVDPLESIFERVQSSVVTLRTTARTGRITAEGTLTSASGIGSGVLVSEDGKIMTAAHVVQAADAVAVQFPNGEVQLANVIASEPSADVALVQLQGAVPAGVTPAKLADSDLTRIASRAFVVGAPLGFSHTLTVGHISARRAPPVENRGLVQAELFQTDAAINQGNSGGPMFNMNGEVIGIVSHILSSSGGNQGLGFAVTSNVARDILFSEHAYWVGLDGVLLTDELARIFNIPGGGDGFLVERVALSSPGYALGLKGGAIVCSIDKYELILGGDIILSAMGVPLSDEARHERIKERVSEAGGIDGLFVTVLRGGEVIKLGPKKTP